jgi:hypothetical protein
MAVTVEDVETYRDYIDGPATKEETPAEKLRTQAWGLNTKCSKPGGVLPEKVKKEAHNLSSKVIGFCEDAKYTDPADWELRAAKFRVLVKEKAEEMDRIEKEIKEASAANPKVAAWDEKEGKYVVAEKRPAGWSQDTGSSAELKTSVGDGSGLEAARARIGLESLEEVSDSVDLSGLRLTDSDLPPLLEEISTSVTSIDLSRNEIQDAGLQTLITACVTRPALKELRLAGNSFGEMGLVMLKGLASLRADLHVVIPAGPTAKAG